MALHVLFNSSKPCLISFKNCCKFRSEISFQVRCSLCLFFFFHPLMENCVRELDVLTLEFLKQKRLCLLSTPYIGPELFHQTKNFVRLSNQFSRINKTKQKLIITTRKKRKRKNREKKKVQSVFPVLLLRSSKRMELLLSLLPAALLVSFFF